MFKILHFLVSTPLWNKWKAYKQILYKHLNLMFVLSHLGLMLVNYFLEYLIHFDCMKFRFGHVVIHLIPFHSTGLCSSNPLELLDINVAHLKFTFKICKARLGPGSKFDQFQILPWQFVQKCYLFLLPIYYSMYSMSNFLGLII